MTATDRRIAAHQAHIATELRAARTVPSPPHRDQAGQRARVLLAIDTLRLTLTALEACVDGEVDASDSRCAVATAAGNLISTSAVLDEMRREGGR